MCGIAGSIWFDPERALDEAALRRMTDVLTHRGPDDQGYYQSAYHLQAPLPASPGVALGHRRLAIIDPVGNCQPIANEDRTVWLIFNGEVYNFRDLRRRLEGSGHRFATDGDTETLVHLYEDEGTEFLRHVNGMFALALWDARKRRLILARDRLGKKPLVYAEQPGRLLFASELKSLLQVPGVARNVDPAAIDSYLTFGYVPHPATIFRGIQKLPPGHYAVYDESGLTVAPYWSPDFSEERPRPAAEYIADVKSLLTSAVELRMQSDVPLGAFLSGGVDSSIVAALMQQLSGERIKTFSIGFDVAEFDETSYARRVAEHLGTEHHEFRVAPAALDVLPKLVWHYDEPFADSSAVPTYYVSRLTREHVTVALSGDGGDELFAGYDRYRAVRLGELCDRLPRAARRLVAARAWQRVPSSGRQKSKLRQLKRFLSALSMPPARRYGDWISIFGESRRADLYTDDFLARLDRDPLVFLERAIARSKGRDAVTAISLADLVTYLPCDLLTKVDIASMSVSLEARQPFLDYRLVELAAAMSIALKYRRGRGKRILRQAFGDLVPAEIFHRKKMGFGVPLDHWFRNELKDHAHEVLLDPQTLARGYFRREAVETLLREHLDRTFDHSARLWSLLMLELWHREWV